MSLVYKKDFMEGVSKTTNTKHPANTAFVVSISALHSDGSDKDYDVVVRADSEREAVVKAVYEKSDWDSIKEIREALEQEGMVFEALYSTNFYVNKITTATKAGVTT